MANTSFHTTAGVSVTAVTADQMRAVDRIAVEEVELAVLQMMEYAGRTLAWHASEFADGSAMLSRVTGEMAGVEWCVLDI